MRQAYNGRHPILHMGTQWSEKLRQAALAILPPSRRLETPIEIVTLKQLTKGSGFGRIVSCVPGKITVIQDSSSPRSESFREALIGKMQSGSMSVRVAGEDLRRSEMFVVGANDFVWQAKSVSQALRQAGVPERQIGGVLDQVGLSANAGSAPTSLSPADLKKLSILHSLFARARLVVYDKPFTGLDTVSTQVLAVMMLNAATQNKRVFLVLGEDVIPNVWNGHSAVKLVSPEKQRAREELGVLSSSDENERLAALVRNLSGKDATAVAVGVGRAAIASQEPTGIVTRPQMIFDASRGKHQEVLRSETINNPNEPEEVREIRKRTSSMNGQRPPVPDAKARSNSKVKRSASGKLTKITWRKRMRRFLPTTQVRMVLKDLVVPPDTEESMSSMAARPCDGLSPIYRKITSFLILLLAMLIVFGTIAVLIRSSLHV